MATKTQKVEILNELAASFNRRVEENAPDIDLEQIAQTILNELPNHVTRLSLLGEIASVSRESDLPEDVQETWNAKSFFASCEQFEKESWEEGTEPCNNDKFC